MNKTCVRRCLKRALGQLHQIRRDFGSLQRQTDGFFVKLAYLFRR